MNVRIKDELEAASVCSVLILGSVECEGIKAKSLEKETKYPFWVAMEKGGSRVLGGKPSGSSITASQFCAAVAGFFHFQHTKEIGKRLEDVRWNLRFSLFVLCGSIAYLALELYDLYRFING